MATIRIAAIVAICVSAAPAQLRGLATTASGRSVYFSTDGTLRRRGSKENFTRKLFLLNSQGIAVIEDSQGLPNSSLTVYDRPVVSADGSVLVVNRSLICSFRGECNGLQIESSLVSTPSQNLTFAGHSDLSANGRFAVVPSSIGSQLLDLSTGGMKFIGQVPPGHIVSDNGSVLISNVQGLQLVGPTQGGPFAVFNGSLVRAILSADASRFLYESTTGEIHAVDTSTGKDRTLGFGQLVAFAEDGRRFSYLRSVGDATLPSFAETQVWIGDAVEGSTARLSEEPEGIVDQTISGDGSAVIAATGTGRLLSIDPVSRAVTELLGSPGPPSLFVTPVPGSYNEIVGTFSKAPPDVLIQNVPVPILEKSPHGYAIQIPWDTPAVDPYKPVTLFPQVLLRGDEPAWERLISGTVQDISPRILPVGPTGPNPPAGTLDAYSDVRSFAYGVHQDWSGVVSGDSPSFPGEIVHFFGSGWGAVDGSVQTGQPTPSDRLYRITLPCDWRATGASRDVSSGARIDAVFAGLAPGLVGIYQIDVRIPSDWSSPVFYAFCLWSSGSNTFSAGNVTAIDVRP